MSRTWLLLLILLCLSPALLLADEPADAAGRTVVNEASVVRYVLGCRKANGAFGPVDQEYTDAAWNYPAVRTLQLLSQPIAEPEKILAGGLGFPTGHAGMSHWLLFHQAMLEKLLTNDTPSGLGPIRVVHQGAEMHYYSHPLGRKDELLYKVHAETFRTQTRAAEELGYYNLASLYYTLAAINARGHAPANGPELLPYILRRQAPSGGFVDVRGSDPAAIDGDAHIATTWQAVGSLQLLQTEIPQPEQIAAFLAQCQGESGAYRARPIQTLPGNAEDVYYTWAAMQTWRALGQTPPRAEACRAWLHSLQNADGGFGDQPGWRSRLYSTYYAVHALALLDEEGVPRIDTQPRSTAVTPSIPPDKYQIFQGLNKMPVCGPADLPGLSQRKLNLLAIKSDSFALAAELREAARRQQLPLDVVLCLEAYPHRALWQTDVLLDHVANVTLDPHWTVPQRNQWHEFDQRGRQSLPWPKYQTEVLRPLQQLAGPIYPEQDFEMEHAYEAYDAGVAGQAGYQAMLAGFNWVPRDFVRVFPWRERYVDKLTIIADCDAHGDLAKWSPQLDHTRHLFLATEPTYAAYLEAAAAGRVVCVIVAPEGVSSGVTYYGRAEAVEYVRKRISEWKWW